MKILNKIINWDKYLLVFKVWVGYFIKFSISEIIPAPIFTGICWKIWNIWDFYRDLLQISDWDQDKDA